jgi:hypothetical protein
MRGIHAVHYYLDSILVRCGSSISLLRDILDHIAQSTELGVTDFVGIFILRYAFGFIKLASI